MKMTKILIAILFVLPLMYSCQGDITELDDPRDAITKLWRVTDDNGAQGANGYDVSIGKHPTEKTQIILNNFHNLGPEVNVTATMAGYTIRIDKQTHQEWTLEGTGTIANDQKSITTVCDETTADGTVTVTARFAEPVVKKKKKKEVQ